ncbi:MAB_1171c family putative transporter [Streptomyces roseochromogenus]|uniref:DUF6545 domain-containing protein n=1 Tax=Streptomyces roseochromogenus subsp. oscitans DS 12.976 TaxID=1352936 RepID=V6KNT4_STRRC|nr:MAB_1171c family putative transporter [Streptomyces roseochromogenus]EST33757.1 hypothetical protein M878_11975 [Streptomyces roseochromogenus subsp. oscitans DS 12.976]
MTLLLRPSGLGLSLQAAGALAIWICVVLRAPAAIRSYEQRILWLAVTTAGLAMTLNLQDISGAVRDVFGPTHLVDLAANLCGVLSSAAVLDFAMVATAKRWSRRLLYTSATGVMTVLSFIDLTSGPHGRHLVTSPAGPTPTAVFWWITVATHLTADTVCVWLLLRHGRHGASQPLKTMLALFALGTAFSGAFWSGYLLLLIGYSSHLPGLLPILMGLHGLLRAAALAIPTFRAATKARTCWHLWPLWRELVDAVPHIALAKPRPRLVELLWPRGSWRLTEYRKIIEIRDAVLVLRDYITPQLAQLARGHIGTSAALTPDRAKAALVACLLKEACSARLAGRPPEAQSIGLTAIGGDDLAEETEFLLEVARAYASPLVGSFSAHIARSA